MKAAWLEAIGVPFVIRDVTAPGASFIWLQSAPQVLLLLDTDTFFRHS